ncbi:PREDICTED: cyclic nucleotide-gated channel rod photoreceptor subunit alpha-like [Priapulus caudatus]|uniref:Cyclic nucleotide-gated channel rod photoreceptor subunit alpha-like n=1 Tax=Priapulus caudatus TaxID=37621 RepID=A0ABM1EBM0_PRICU|nr:PREDICTED: cyclic nucleotide-gated channel rod photoreceptor subunit alpha-like [Priapulus caudatus]
MASHLGRLGCAKDSGKIVKYMPCTEREDRLEEAELDEISVIGGGSMDSLGRPVECAISTTELTEGRHSPVTANGPKLIPVNLAIIDDRTRLIGERLSSSGTRINIPSPTYSSTASMRSPKGTINSSSSRTSLLDACSSAIHVDNGKHGKSLSKEDQSYVNKAAMCSDGEITQQKNYQRRRKIPEKCGKWEMSIQGSHKHLGCNMTFVFDPSGRLCYYWSIIVSVAFLYNFWVLIYRFSFDEISNETMVMWFSLDYLADVIYILDVGVGFRTGYLEDGVLQTDPVKLRQHYMNCTRFYIDCLCLLPLEFLYLSIGFNTILRCFRLVKIYRFWEMLDRTERHTNYPNSFRAIGLIHYLLVIFHWNACLYYIISQKIGSGSRAWNNPFDKDDKLRNYLHSFYWSTVTLTMIGDLPKPRTNVEYLFCIMETIASLLLFATVLGHVANIVTNISTARKEFQAKLDGVKTYMNLRRVPRHLQEKVIRWFDYLWISKKSADEEKPLCYLPDKLKGEIAIHVHLDTLKKVEIFQNTEAGFLCELVLRLKPVLFSPGDYICRKGEVGKEMYIVNRGRLQVVADNGKTVLATLKASSYFGEISILNMGTAGNRRTASVRSVGYSDLFCLAKMDLWDVLKEYPAARVRLEAVASKRLKNYKKAPLERAAMNRSSSTPGLVESFGKQPIQAPFHYNTLPVMRTVHTGRSQETLATLQCDNDCHAKQFSRRGSVLGDAGVCRQEHDGSNEFSSDAGTECELQTVRPSARHQVPISASSIPLSHSSSASELLQGWREPSGDSVAFRSGAYSKTDTKMAVKSEAKDSSQEILLVEVKQLRERLAWLETDNTSMSLRLTQQQWEVENRLAEIEIHMCGSSSAGSTTSTSDERTRINQESVI